MKVSGTRASAWGGVPAVVLVVAAMVGAWALWGGQPLPASARNVPPSGEAGRLAADPLAVADFGSATESYEHVRAFEDLVGLRFLNQAEVDAYRGAGAGAARMTLSSRRPEGRVLVTVVRVADRETALATAFRLDELQFDFGLERAEPEHGVTRVTRVLFGPDTDPAVRPTVRAHYVHGDLVVRVELNARSRDLMSRFGDVLAVQLKALAADG
ncbi:hypothetical protein [Saccharothrix sp. Mg75]|uniref:hypothetical protein n=1 Tax=Saccharothrix sp. Mg75 TaxID=3445357 RepID=UPI003EECB639